MTTAPLTLTSFLLARIAEDEAVAREATPGPWYADDLYSTVTAAPFTSAPAAYDRPDTEVDCWVIPESMDSGVGSHNLAHIARHDPARVLAECEAKRAIVERESARLHEQWRRAEEHMQTFEEWFAPPYGETLRDLASVYADHPDYREEWRP